MGIRSGGCEVEGGGFDVVVWKGLGLWCGGGGFETENAGWCSRGGLAGECAFRCPFHHTPPSSSTVSPPTLRF